MLTSSSPSDSPSGSLPVATADVPFLVRRQQAADRLGVELGSWQPGGPLPGLTRPTTNEEIWRYSRVAKLSLDTLVLAAPGGLAQESPPPIGEVAAQVVVVDGHVQSITVSPAASAAGLVIRSAAQSADLILPPVTDADVFAEAAVAASADALVIDVPAGATVSGVVQILNQVATAGAFVPSSLVIRLAANAALSVVERVMGDAPGALFVPVTQLRLADGATLRFVSIQELGADCSQVAFQESVTGRDATLRSMAVALGGSYARVRTDAVVPQQGGFNELLAVYFGAGHQMHDFRTLQHHVGPRTTSELLFKGAVQDHAQSVYSGLIKIGEHARNAVANQANRNLLLSPTASVESVPNLEIENNEVKCSHASAVGPVDEDHRYYLELRGVPPEEAERLIITGFFADVLDRSPVPGVAEALTGVFAAKFGAADAARTAIGAAR